CVCPALPSWSLDHMPLALALSKGECVYLHSPIGPQPYPVIYAVVNSVRGLLYRKIPGEHPQSSSEREHDNKRRDRKKTKSKYQMGYLVGIRGLMSGNGHHAFHQ
ncbi:unnamed protein product, partial [Ascophyllum nodosum]